MVEYSGYDTQKYGDFMEVMVFSWEFMRTAMWLYQVRYHDKYHALQLQGDHRQVCHVDGDTGEEGQRHPIHQRLAGKVCDLVCANLPLLCVYSSCFRGEVPCVGSSQLLFIVNEVPASIVTSLHLSGEETGGAFFSFSLERGITTVVAIGSPISVSNNPSIPANYLY